MEPFALPQTFLLGTATASVQIEGGDKNNSWYRWAEQGYIRDGSHCIQADDHWNRMEEDIRLMKRLNVNAYRMSIEWARIEPERGKFDEDAMKHYREELSLLVGNGIIPFVTLHHFSNPLWFEDDGAWLNPECIELFCRYVEHVVKNLGDLVDNWITINEPNVYLAFGYVFGIWPPGASDIGSYFRGADHMIRAHISAYETIHRVRKSAGFPNTGVSAAFHLRVYDPKSLNPLDRIPCWLLERFFQDMFICGMIEGKPVFPIKNRGLYKKGRYMDFFSVNYYTRDMVSFSPNPALLFGKREVKPDASVNDLGWEIYPEGLRRLCRKYFMRYGLPIYITENGICDGKDIHRAEYILEHLYQIRLLLDEGIDVRGYFHWTLMDNFEWLEGLSARFGLYEVDFETQTRILRRSGKLYSEVCAQHEVTASMIAGAGQETAAE